jgi:hypothetical protein
MCVVRWVHTCNVTAYRNAVTLQVTDTVRSYGLNIHPVPHCVTASCERYTRRFPDFYGSQKHHECKGDEWSVRWWRVTLPDVARPAQVVTVSFLLMRWPNTDSAPNMPLTLQRKQLLIRYVVASPVHTVTVRCYDMWWRYKCVPTFTDTPNVVIVYTVLLVGRCLQNVVIVYTVLLVGRCLQNVVIVYTVLLVGRCLQNVGEHDSLHCHWCVIRKCS